MTTGEDAAQPILVTGGTGKTGRRIAQRLNARGLTTRIASRSGRSPFSWTDPAGWGPALHGVQAAYVSYYPDLAVPEAQATIGSFAELAVRSGVRRLVLLSGRGEASAQRAECALRAAGAECTVLRSSWFNQNFSEGYLLEPILAGELVLPAGELPEPFVDADDLADVAVAALTESGHADQVYELSGPRLLSFGDAADEIGKARGRQIRYRPVSVEQYASTLLEYGLPPEFVSLMTYLFTEVLDGRNAHLTDGVQRALGHPARDFSDYARDAAATGVWDSR